MSVPEQTINERMNAYLQAQEEPEAEAVAVEEPAELEEVAQEAEEVETEYASIKTWAELAEHNGITQEELYDVSVPIEVNGKTEYKTVSELKDLSRTNLRATEAIQQSKQAREAIEAERRQMQATIQQVTSEASQVLTATEEQLMYDFNKVDWDSLRQQNPTEWAAKRQELGERQQTLQNMRTHAQQNYEQMLGQQKAQNEAEIQRIVEREHERLLEAVPSWQKAETATTEKAELRAYLLSEGYTEDEIDMARDHRVIKLALNSMRYARQKTQAAVAKKKVPQNVRVPLKPGARQSNASRSNDRVKESRAQLRKTGKVSDAVALYEKLNGA